MVRTKGCTGQKEYEAVRKDFLISERDTRILSAGLEQEAEQVIPCLLFFPLTLRVEKIGLSFSMSERLVGWWHRSLASGGDDFLNVALEFDEPPVNLTEGRDGEVEEWAEDGPQRQIPAWEGR